MSDTQEKTTATLEAATEIQRSPVTILDDTGQVDKPVVHIRWGEEVEWISKADHDAEIVFAERPFDWKERFVAPHGGRKKSGPHKKDAIANHNYKYTVIGKTRSNDPIIIIDK